MEGYIKNISPLWRHALKRSIGPGEKIFLDELYSNYGIKHDIAKGKPFIDWLREVKLRDKDVWEIRYKEEDMVPIDQSIKTEESLITNKKAIPAPFVKTELTADELATLSVRQLKDMLERVVDTKILKYALSKASQLQGKETVCKMFRKRIQMLELSRRM